MEEQHTLHLEWNRRKNHAYRNHRGDGIDSPVLNPIKKNVYQSDFYNQLLHYGSQLINLSTSIMPHVHIDYGWIENRGRLYIPVANSCTFEIFTDDLGDAVILKNDFQKIFQLYLMNNHKHTIMYGNNFIGNNLIVLQGEHVNYAVDISIDTKLSKAVKMETKKLPTKYSTSIVYGITDELLWLCNMNIIEYFSFIEDAIHSLSEECKIRGYL